MFCLINGKYFQRYQNKHKISNVFYTYVETTLNVMLYPICAYFVVFLGCLRMVGCVYVKCMLKLRLQFYITSAKICVTIKKYCGHIKSTYILRCHFKKKIDCKFRISYHSYEKYFSFENKNILKSHNNTEKNALKKLFKC